MIIRKNPFQEIYAVCNSGNSLQKLKNLPDFPRYMDIESTNNCNFRCLMCPSGTFSMKRKRGFMEDDIFYKIIEEIKPYKTPLRFIRWGEPFLHPKLVEYIKAAKSIGSIVHINTNGSLMGEDVIDELLEIPLDSIKFSFQGADKDSYREVRNIDYYEDLVNTVKLLYDKRADREYPHIHISTTITYETAEQVKGFKDKVKNYADLVTIGRTNLELIDLNNIRLGDAEIKMLSYLKERQSLVKKHPECPEVFDKLSINWDGSVSACCGDYDNKMIVSDIKANSLKEMWNSEELNHYRAMLSEKRHDELDLCKTCYDYMGLQTPGLQKIE